MVEAPDPRPTRARPAPDVADVEAGKPIHNPLLDELLVDLSDDYRVAAAAGRPMLGDEEDR